MLLDPFEEQLHLPATAVQLCDPQGWQCGVVGEKFRSFVALFVMILDAPEFFRIVVRSFHTSEPHGLIADHTDATVNGVGVKSSQGGIGFGSKHEETAKLMQSEKAGEVKVGAIHDVEGTAFRQQHIHDINIMQFAIGDMDECWDISLQIQQSMEFYRGFGFAKPDPREQRQAQVYGRGIQGIDGVVEIQAIGFSAIKRTRGVNELLCEIGIDSPVSDLIGIGQRISRDATGDADVIEFAGMYPQTDFDVAKTFPVGQLGKRHAAILFCTSKRFDFVVTVVASNAVMKGVPRQMIH